MEPLEQVAGKTLENCVVEIDGKEFIDCVFQNCTIRFAGKRRFELGGSKFGRGVRWELDKHAHFTAWYFSYLASAPPLDQIVRFIFDDILAGKIEYPESPDLGFAPRSETETPKIKVPSVEMLEQPKTLTVLAGRVFENEEVRLDGYQFEDCTFKNCTFLYGATAEMQMIGCKTEGSLGMLFDQNALFMLNFLGNLARSSVKMLDEIVARLRKTETGKKPYKVN